MARSDKIESSNGVVRLRGVLYLIMSGAEWNVLKKNQIPSILSYDKRITYNKNKKSASIMAHNEAVFFKNVHWHLSNEITKSDKNSNPASRHCATKCFFDLCI